MTYIPSCFASKNLSVYAVSGRCRSEGLATVARTALTVQSPPLGSKARPVGPSHASFENRNQISGRRSRSTSFRIAQPYCQSPSFSGSIVIWSRSDGSQRHSFETGMTLSLSRVEDIHFASFVLERTLVSALGGQSESFRSLKRSLKLGLLCYRI